MSVKVWVIMLFVAILVGVFFYGGLFLGEFSAEGGGNDDYVYQQRQLDLLDKQVRVLEQILYVLKQQKR